MMEVSRFVLLLCFPVIKSSPLKIMEIHPISVVAPVSQIHWSYHDNWSNNLMSDIEIPSSFQTQHLKTNAKDHDTMPSHIQFTVNHPKYFPRPKSLHISLEPSSGDSSKLKITDTFLDSVQQFTTPTTKRQTTTTRPKKRPTAKRPKPQTRPHKSSSKSSEIEMYEEQSTTIATSTSTSTTSTSTTSTSTPLQRPNNNHLAGQSQIGNRESQMVIKPTVIVNFRGTVSNHESDIVLEGRADEENDNYTGSGQNIFNISQEVRIENVYSMENTNEDPTNKKPKSHSKIEVQFNDSDKKPKSLALTSEDAEPLETVPEADLSKKMYVFNIGPLGGFLRY